MAITDTTTWHMIAATKSGSARVIYVDGVDVTEALPANATATNNTDAFEIGRHFTAIEYFNGSIDEVAIFKSALTPAQIDNLWRLGVGAEGTAAVSAAAELASGTGTALAASIRISPNALIASGVGVATGAWTNIKPNAGSATGTGAASGVSAHVKPNAGIATGTGSALAAIPNPKIAAAVASGTGLAYNVIPLVKPNAVWRVVPARHSARPSKSSPGPMWLRASEPHTTPPSAPTRMPRRRLRPEPGQPITHLFSSSPTRAWLLVPGLEQRLRPHQAQRRNRHGHRQRQQRHRSHCSIAQPAPDWRPERAPPSTPRSRSRPMPGWRLGPGLPTASARHIKPFAGIATGRVPLVRRSPTSSPMPESRPAPAQPTP